MAGRTGYEQFPPSDASIEDLTRLIDAGRGDRSPVESWRHATILFSRYCCEPAATLREAAQMVGVRTGERARQLEAHGLRYIRRGMFRDAWRVEGGRRDPLGLRRGNVIGLNTRLYLAIFGGTADEPSLTPPSQ